MAPPPELRQLQSRLPPDDLFPEQLENFRQPVQVVHGNIDEKSDKEGNRKPVDRQLRFERKRPAANSFEEEKQEQPAIGDDQRKEIEHREVDADERHEIQHRRQSLQGDDA